MHADNLYTDGLRLHAHPSVQDIGNPIRRCLEIKEERLNRLLELFGGAEGNLLARLDLDCFAGRGITAHARRAPAYLQDAETV